MQAIFTPGPYQQNDDNATHDGFCGRIARVILTEPERTEVIHDDER